MSTPRSVKIVALLAACAVLLTLGGVADAAGRKIGKNLVVTKSIKNGAVTGPKVKDGSLTAADLAPGTIPVVPAPTNGKAAVFATMGTFNANADGSAAFMPFGEHTSGVFPVVAPVDLTVADFHVVTDLQAAGESMQFYLVTAPTLDPIFTPVLQCTVVSGATGCSSTQQGTIPAGNMFWGIARNGPTGPSTDFATISYTMRVR
ncbi:MAG TPA: hypothetical protein VFV89_02835 [Nocardioides sp.]|uniref:hypothetical protein n=1 Tax=Nocardioides sp. TaxID=35761 RepID=UPI002E33A3D9|nr:hypothetical protein [Nocardioides sp.]HEX5086715.1 hypothetical protein [Nocardioides sp.]